MIINNIKRSPSEKLLIYIDAFTEYTGRFISWLMLAMVILSFSIVVIRYGFNIGTTAVQEGVLYLHAIIFMLGAAYTLKHDGHVRVDIFYQNMSLKTKAIVDVFGALLLLIPFSVFVFCICFDYVIQSWSIAEQSSEPGGLAFVYLNKTLLLILPIVLILQGVAEVIRQFLTIQSYKNNLPPASTVHTDDSSNNSHTDKTTTGNN